MQAAAEIRHRPEARLHRVGLFRWVGDAWTLSLKGCVHQDGCSYCFQAALSAAGITVVEVECPRRRNRRGKSGPADAGVVALKVLRMPEHPVEAIRVLRVLRVPRKGAIKARTAAFDQFHEVIVSAPAKLRADWTGATRAAVG